MTIKLSQQKQEIPTTQDRHNNKIIPTRRDNQWNSCSVAVDRSTHIRKYHVGIQLQCRVVCVSCWLYFRANNLERCIRLLTIGGHISLRYV